MPISAIKDLLDIFDRVAGHREALARAVEFSRSRYFYHEDLVKHLLWRRNMADLPRSAFIDYPAFLKYYHANRWQIDYTRDGVLKHVELPYTIEIDFVTNPDSRIHIRSITPHEMPATTLSMTEANLRRYKETKTNTKDGPILRLAHWEHIHGINYECRLETSTYWMQSRTNLTIDLPLEHDSSKSLRTLDLDDNGNLKAFHESLLVNSLGVCGVLYYIANDGSKRFFMKRRRDSEGVFEDMLGTTSGVVTFVPGQTPSELVSFVQTEMLREFMRETGCTPDKVWVKRIEPLAFCRDLTRGGKPQFFFAIEVEELTEHDFQELFVKSPEGLEEFVDGVLAGRLDYARSLSPEFAMNLALAMRFFAHQARQPVNPLNLS